MEAKELLLTRYSASRLGTRQRSFAKGGF